MMSHFGTLRTKTTLQLVKFPQICDVQHFAIYYQLDYALVGVYLRLKIIEPLLSQFEVLCYISILDPLGSPQTIIHNSWVCYGPARVKCVEILGALRQRLFILNDQNCTNMCCNKLCMLPMKMIMVWVWCDVSLMISNTVKFAEAE